MLNWILSFSIVGITIAAFNGVRYLFRDISQKNVVITGATRGLGLAMAEEFCKSGDNVVICSRSKEQAESVANELQQRYPEVRVYGTGANVSINFDVAALADFSIEMLGSIDIWINNAGVSNPLSNQPLAKVSTTTIHTIVTTNILGTLFGCKEALRVMLPSKSGHIFNVDGAGSSGRATPNMSVYGATKACIPQLTKSLSQEYKHTGVGVHAISPGMVITSLLVKENTPEKAKKIFNILAELPEVPAEYLVKKMRNVTGTGHYIKYLTMTGVLWRFLCFPLRKNRFFLPDGSLRADIKL